MTDIREELMPRSMSFIRLSALVAAVAVVALVSGASAAAQDADAVEKAANDALKAIQTKLAAGKDAEGKDAPNLKQLRIDGFKAKDGKVVVSGVYIDTGKTPPNKAEGTNDARFGESAKQLILKHINVDKAVPFNWDVAVDVYGAVDTDGKPEEGKEPPHVKMQTAANTAGATQAAADQVYLTSSRFGPGGELVVSGVWAADPAGVKWLTDHWLGGALANHPAARRKAGDKAAVVLDDVKKLDKWPLALPGVRKIMAESKDAALRRTRVDRVYFTYQNASPRLIVTGVRLGEDKLTGDAVKEEIKQLWPDVVTTIASAPSAEILNGLTDPAPDVQAAVARVRALDGIRVDPGATFSAAGEVVLVGLQPDQPELTADQRAQLTKEFRAVVLKKATQGDATASRYKLLGESAVSTAGMTRIALGTLDNDLRQWAIKYRDDIRFRRLCFASDPKAFEPQYYSVAKDGGGLVLVYQAAAEADVKAVAAEFQRAFARHFPKGLPGAAPDATAAGSEPLLPGLTAELRRLMTADQKQWYGVLIERGYFDKDDRYTLAGVVDTDEQNAKLQALLTKLKGEERWKAYFRDTTGAEQPAVAPKLVTIPMDKMVARVQRVMPAHPEFDGVRVESAYYDPELRLTFKAHAVGRVTPAQVGKLADLLVGDPTYTRRVVKPEQPADPSAPRIPPKVRIVQTNASTFADEQVANFSLGLGGSLLAKASASKEAKAKAKEWLDAALLHYPNESAVWFLNAYYNFTSGERTEQDRDELVKRDLYRMAKLEGSLTFDGPAQRKRRYEAAKDLQGSTRNKLEELVLLSFREAKDGAKPITLSGK